MIHFLQNILSYFTHLYDSLIAKFFRSSNSIRIVTDHFLSRFVYLIVYRDFKILTINDVKAHELYIWHILLVINEKLNYYYHYIYFSESFISCQHWSHPTYSGKNKMIFKWDMYLLERIQCKIKLRYSFEIFIENNM